MKYLAEYGGNNVYETVARILKNVLATELARTYNFKGTKGKRKFESLNLTNIIYRKYCFIYESRREKTFLRGFQPG